MIQSNTMSDRATLPLLTNNVQTRAFRSHSFNPPPPLGSNRSRRTLSLPAREKPFIPPSISENPECSELDSEEHLEDVLQPQPQQQEQAVLTGGNCGDEIGWLSPVLGLIVSLLLYAWACLLSLSANDKDTFDV